MWHTEKKPNKILNKIFIKNISYSYDINISLFKKCIYPLFVNLMHNSEADDIKFRIAVRSTSRLFLTV